MNLILMFIWMAFWYCFVSDVFGRSLRERPDRWPGYRLRFHRQSGEGGGQGVAQVADGEPLVRQAC